MRQCTCVSGFRLRIGGKFVIVELKTRYKQVEAVASPI